MHVPVVHKRAVWYAVSHQLTVSCAYTVLRYPSFPVVKDRALEVQGTLQEDGERPDDGRRHRTDRG